MALMNVFKQMSGGRDGAGGGLEIASVKPSGAQWARSALVGELAERLAFGIMVADFVTHAIVPTADGPVEVDALVEGQFDPDHSGFRWAVFVDDGELSADAAEIVAVTRWCEGWSARVAIIGEPGIRAPHLSNARALRAHADLPDPADPHLRTLFELVDAPEAQPMSVAAVVAALVAYGAEAAHARTLILKCVATGLVGCDLSLPFDDHAKLSRLFEGWKSPYDNRRDPILAALIATRRT